MLLQLWERMSRERRIVPTVTQIAGPELKPLCPGPILPSHLHPQSRSHSCHHWELRTSSCLLGRKTMRTSKKTSGSRYRISATHENLPRKTTAFLPDSYRQWPYLPGQGPKTKQVLPGDPPKYSSLSFWRKAQRR